jgi:alanine dehydrogenase
MFIGVPKEIKADEYRVGLIPATIKELTARGHQVAVETMAGAGADIVDQDYAAAGAQIVASVTLCPQPLINLRCVVRYLTAPSSVTSFG